MDKEQAKPADKSIDYSAFKGGEYVKIISGKDKVEYSAKVIDLYNDKIRLNLADGTEKKLDINYIHSINIIDKPSDFKPISLKIVEKKIRKIRKSIENNEGKGKSREKDGENDGDNDSLEGRVSNDE